MSTQVRTQNHFDRFFLFSFQHDDQSCKHTLGSDSSAAFNISYLTMYYGNQKIRFYDNYCLMILFLKIHRNSQCYRELVWMYYLELWTYSKGNSNQIRITIIVILSICNKHDLKVCHISIIVFTQSSLRWLKANANIITHLYMFSNLRILSHKFCS